MVPGKKSLRKTSPHTRFPQFGVCGIMGWALSLFCYVWGRRVGSVDKYLKNCPPSLCKFSGYSYNRGRFSSFQRTHLHGNFFSQGTFFPGTIFTTFFLGTFYSVIFFQGTFFPRTKKTDVLEKEPDFPHFSIFFIKKFTHVPQNMSFFIMLFGFQ